MWRPYHNSVDRSPERPVQLVGVGSLFEQSHEMLSGGRKNEKLGFRARGEVFMDAGIPYQNMVKRLD